MPRIEWLLSTATTASISSAKTERRVSGSRNKDMCPSLDVAGEPDVVALSHRRLFTNLPVIVNVVALAHVDGRSVLLTRAGVRADGGKLAVGQSWSAERGAQRDYLHVIGNVHRSR